MLGVICVPNIVCEAIWPWTFVCREVFGFFFFFFNNRFYFTASDQSIQIICFFLVVGGFPCWWVVFLETCPFLLSCPIS